MIKLLNRGRRKLGMLIDKNYIKKKLEKRRGKCRKCGECCRGCKFLDKNKLCTIYEQRPYFCHKDFPLDRIDQKVWGIKNCGYKF